MIKLNGAKIDVTNFPDGTSQVWHIPEALFETNGNFAVVEWNFDSEAEFMHLAQLKSLLDKRNMQAYLLINYLPYGRQDKHVTNDETFALRTFALLLNTLAFKAVSILDPHSAEALNLLDNATAFYKKRDVLNLIKTLNIGIVCYPDQGAKAKYSHIFDFQPTVYAFKVRNKATGIIEKYDLAGSIAVRGLNVLIVDDICDGGSTFVKLAVLLKEAGAKEINLFVTHGLFTKGLQDMQDAGINRIFSKDGEAIQIDKDTVGHKHNYEKTNT